MCNNIGDEQDFFVVDVIEDLKYSKVMNQIRFKYKLRQVFFLERMRMTTLENQVFQDAFYTHQIFQKMRYIYWKIEHDLITKLDDWILKDYDQVCEEVLSSYKNLEKEVEIFIDNSLNVTRYKLEALIAYVKIKSNPSKYVMVKQMNFQHLTILYKYVYGFVFEQIPDYHIKKMLKFYNKPYRVLGQQVKESYDLKASKSQVINHEKFEIGVALTYQVVRENSSDNIDFIYIDLDSVYMHAYQRELYVRKRLYQNVDFYDKDKRIIIKMPDMHFLMLLHEIPDTPYFNDAAHILKAYSLYQYEAYWAKKMLNGRNVEFIWPNIVKDDLFHKLKESLPNQKKHHTGLLIHDTQTHQHIESIKGFDNIVFNIEELMLAFEVNDLKCFYKEQLQYLHYYVSRRRRKDIFNIIETSEAQHIDYLLKRGVKRFIVESKDVKLLEKKVSEYLASRGRYAKR